MFKRLHYFPPLAVYFSSLLVAFEWQVDCLDSMERFITEELDCFPFNLVRRKHLFKLR